MDNPTLNIPEAAASEICARLYLDKAALALASPAMSPLEFVEALNANEQYLAAMDFLAHALPVRESIWWGCLCLQKTCGDKLEPWEKHAFRMAVQWVLQPDDANREAARQPAEVLGPSNGAGCLAAAVTQTGGSVGPPQGPVIPPSPFGWARAVAISVKVASSKAEKRQIQSAQRSLVDLGIAIAEGRFPPKSFQ